MIYAAPGAPGAKLTHKAQYDNFIGGKAFHTRSRLFTDEKWAEPKAAGLV